MQIISVNTILGPNVFHHDPVVIMRVDLSELTETASNQIPEFNKKITELLPGLQKHHCSPGYEGGFCERLHRGTYLAHIIEHVALELSSLAGIEVNYGKTRYAGTPGHYSIVTKFVNEDGMRTCLRTAFCIVEDIIKGSTVNLEKEINFIRSSAFSSKNGGPTTEAILSAAKRKQIPISVICAKSGLFQLGYGKKRRLFQTAVTDRTSLIGADLVQDKHLTKELLEKHAINTPQGKVVYDLQDLSKAMESMRPPYVVKPVDGHHGNGVALNLYGFEEVKTAFESAQKFSTEVLLEEMCKGNDFRVLVINGKFVAAAERKPPIVTGNGHLTIEELINLLNADPRRAEGHAAILSNVVIDDIMIQHLKKNGRSLTSVVDDGETIELRGNSNLSTGGTAKDVTDLIHPEVKRCCEKIARLVNLDLCGVDIIHSAAADPLNENFNVIEVNAAPGLRMHVDPTEGQPRNVTDAMIDMMFKSPEDARIPIVAITGTNGKTTVSRLIHKIVSSTGACVGSTTTDGIWIGNDKIVSGDTTGPKSSEMVLTDPAVEYAVLEVARGGLLRGGLFYDWADVGIITNISEDHFGQDGIEEIRDLVWIKSLVAERVRPDGAVILNADNLASLNIRDNPRLEGRQVFLFSANESSTVIYEHLLKGGNACWIEEGAIYVKFNSIIREVIKINEVPITLNGTAIFQISNILAAVAATVSLNIPLEKIRSSLREINPAADNLGRLNIYQVGKAYAILDYAHNPDALQAMGELVSHWNGKKTSVVGLPGDRSDHLIQESAAILAASFDQIILRDDLDLRGRKIGEVPQIIKSRINELSIKAHCSIAPNQLSSIKDTLNNLVAGELLVIFYDDFETAWNLLKEHDPVPLSEFPPNRISDEDRNLRFVETPTPRGLGLQ